MSQVVSIFRKVSGRSGLGRVFSVLGILTMSIGTVSPAVAALPEPTACFNDLQGANDEPGQKDITRFCAEEGTGTPFEIHTIVDWDDIALSGNNTQDICTLFDSDDDGLADLAVCTTLVAGPNPDGIVTLGELRLFRCGDDKPDRCTNSTFLPGPYTTTCEVSEEKTDPFSPAALNGPGDEYPNDTQITCALDLNEFGLPGTQAVLIDACSFPSTEPNSDPSDCVAAAQCVTDDDCNDGNVCTTDSCNNQGNCLHKPKKGKTSCSDGFFCDGDDECNNNGLCQPNTDGRDCTDDVGCTVDSCDELHDTCLHEPRNTLCTDNTFCNGVEICSAVDDCQPGTPPNCNDNVSCTADSCNEDTDSCNHVTNDASCNNGQFCDGTETCSAILGCQPGTAPNCNDDITCTQDSCNEANDQCVHAPSNAACSDGQFCTGDETCSPVDGCHSGTTRTCNDGIDCTADSCNEALDRCDNLPQNNGCDDGQFCTGIEVCDPTQGCKPGDDPCPERCNEQTDQCVQCLTNADCNDSAFCNGVETCNVSGTCVPGTPPDCTDTVNCTTDQCDEGSDQCTHTPNNGICSDGQFCNGAEVCDLVNGCSPGTAPACADDVTCTTDDCDETNDQCTHTPNDAACSNNQFCDGAETCDLVLGCQSATAPDCTDDFACTTDSCNETLDRCDHITDDSACSDGQFCNGDEVCNAQTGCGPGSPVVCHDAFNCSTDNCNEDTDSCAFDFSTCVCGDSEVTGTEKCDPPATAGTFEDCNNMVDDDGDGKVDCRDKSCKPGARAPICDETCDFDQVCTKFIRDPATITFNRDGVPDMIYIHGRIAISGNPEPLVDGMQFELSNESTQIYRAELGWGELNGKLGGRKYQFQDNYASIFGQASPAGGLARVRLKIRLHGGRPYLVFTIRAYGDMSAADQWLMTTQFSVGSEVGYLTEEWEATSTGWKLHQVDF